MLLLKLVILLKQQERRPSPLKCYCRMKNEEEIFALHSAFHIAFKRTEVLIGETNAQPPCSLGFAVRTAAKQWKFLMLTRNAIYRRELY
jgi:hypothetical protein